MSVTGPPAVCELNLSMIVTVMAGMIWKLKTNVCVGSATALAVIVAVSFAGSDLGGVYTADIDGAGAGCSVPQPGEQFVLAIDKFQFTPCSLPGPLTDAAIVTDDDPAPTNVNVLVRFTTTGAPLEFELDFPHAAQSKLVPINNTSSANRFMPAFTIEWGRSSYEFENS